jgi:hypothetical protein
MADPTIVPKYLPERELSPPHTHPHATIDVDLGRVICFGQ